MIEQFEKCESLHEFSVKFRSKIDINFGAILELKNYQTLIEMLSNVDQKLIKIG